MGDDVMEWRPFLALVSYPAPTLLSRRTTRSPSRVGQCAHIRAQYPSAAGWGRVEMRGWPWVLRRHGLCTAETSKPTGGERTEKEELEAPSFVGLGRGPSRPLGR